MWQQAEIAVQMRDLPGLGVILPSKSMWAAEVILIKEKGNKDRMVVDSRPLNRVKVMDTYPTGKIQNMLDLLHRNQWFTAFYLAFVTGFR